MKRYHTYLLSLFSLLALAPATNAAEPRLTDTPVTITSELGYPVVDKNNPQSNYIKVSLTGNPIIESNQRSPINISLVIDRSGSMRGEKIQKAREAALLAVDMLNTQDKISVIGYDYSAEVIVPATRLTNKAQVKNQIRNAIRADGNTALFAGVSKGIGEVKKFLNKNHVNRVILLSDGQANVGPSTSSELGELGIVAAKQGIAVTTIGLGEGYNEDLMTTLAGYSDGNHFFVENAGDLELAFNQEFNDVMNVVAQAVEVNIHVKHGTPKRLLGRHGKIRGQHVSVKLNQIYANQEKYVLLEIAPAKTAHQGEKTLANIEVSYQPHHRDKPYQQKLVSKILYTDNQALVEQSANENVLADVFIQESNLANKRAIEALDKGDKKASETILYGSLKQSYDYSDSIDDPKVKAKVEQQIQYLEESQQAIQKSSENKARKVLKKNSYKVKKQQK